MCFCLQYECTDITTVEELSVFCRWEEGGIPIECFLDILPSKKADAETICPALLNCLKDNNLQISKIVGVGFDGASISGSKTGVQSWIKKHAPHAIFVYCHCHLLQLACVQQHRWHKACFHHLDHPVEIFPLLSKKKQSL